MIHEWFMSFGAIAAVCAVVAYIITRQLAKLNPPKNAEDRGGRAVGFFFFGFLTAVVLGISFLLVLFGVTATIPGWIGCALAGVTFALLTD
jgi:hypothetical protein